MYGIDPYVGMGPIKLGMTREQVRSALGMQAKEYRKTQWDDLLDDAFDSIGIHVAYRVPDVCTFVECFGPVSPTFRGENFLQKPFRDVRQWFETIDPAISVDGTGLTSRVFGITIYAPAAIKEPDEPVEGVGIFERGYYDRVPRTSE